MGTVELCQSHRESLRGNELRPRSDSGPGLVALWSRSWPWSWYIKQIKVPSSSDSPKMARSASLERHTDPKKPRYVLPHFCLDKSAPGLDVTSISPFQTVVFGAKMPVRGRALVD